MTKTKKEVPILKWDECNIIESEIQFRLDNKEDEALEGLDEEDIRQMVYDDVDVIARAWEDMVDELSMIMANLTKRNTYDDEWVASVEGFGWRNLDGVKEFTASTGLEFIRELLPDCYCTFRIYKDGRNRLKINNFHHDSPMGEWYYVRPKTKREVEKDDGY